MKYNLKNNLKTWLMLSMRSLLFPAAFFFCSFITQKELSEITHWWTLTASAVNLVTIVVLMTLCRRRHTTCLEMIRYRNGQKRIGRCALFVLAMLFMGMGGMYLAGALCYGTFPYLAPMMIAPVSPALSLLNILILPFTTTLAEDGLYLGYGVNRFSSKWAAVLIPAFFYALQHCFIPTIWDLNFIIYRFLSFLPLTIWICFQYRKGCPVSYIMTGHWVLNIATTVQIAVTSFHPEFYARLTR